MTDDEILANLDLYYPPAMSPAERTKLWRENMRLAGRPDTRAVDAALVEATSFLLSLATGSPVTIEAAALVRVSTIILVRDGYDRQLSKGIVVDRLRPRDRHDEISAIPSRRLSSNARVIQPPRAGEWSEKDIAYIRQLAEKQVSTPVTSSNGETELQH